MAAKDAPPVELAPRTTSYEFFGPPGALFVTLTVPAITYGLFFACSETNGCTPSISTIPDQIVAAVSSPEWWASLWDTQAALMYLAWYAFTVVAWFVLPGDWVQGTTLRTGGKQSYKLNAFATFLLALGLTSGTIYRFGPSAFTLFYDKWVGFVTASVLMATVQAVYCYAFSFHKGKLLAAGGNSGNFIYDFFIGRELNPSIGSFDIKSFNELRPGLILWVLVNISMACEQAVRRGGITQITDSMWLVLAFQGWYVADGLFSESALFTTMDITTDGFGFMLAIGDLSWVPFVYSLQARYLVFKQVELGPVWTAVIFLANATGYFIFRDSNGEKNDFRNGSNPKNLKFFTTASGSKLLTSGWWGRSRHPNYFGDLLMAFAWSLPTGFNTPITYFYVSYFAVLLIHRQRRDEAHCQKKYGKDWDTYKKLESLNFRANLARLVSPLRRVRPRVPFFQLAAHRIPTLWSLYRGLLKEAPTDEIKWRVKALFRENQHLTGTGATTHNLLKGYKYLDAFKKANAGDKHQQAVMERYSRALGSKSDRAYWFYLARKEHAWQARLANRPIMTGGFLRPSFANGPLPRLKPQPIHITGMIRKRRAARQRRMETLADLQEHIQDLNFEAKLEAGAAELAGMKGQVEPVFAEHMGDWMEPIKQQQEAIKETFPRDQRRRDAQYPKEMFDAIMAARREKIANKTRERERERRGEILRRTVLRLRKGPPAHVLATLTPEQRRMDRVVRNVSEVGYVAKIKTKLGFKLRDPTAWKAEIGAPEDKERLDRMARKVLNESERRAIKASKQERDTSVHHET
ncbi:hypothetical protein DXG01_007184 [Tephrocybe rancida]|nr:hypothetical protein DXG01_007184 [Tephrocybe rancida]